MTAQQTGALGWEEARGESSIRNGSVHGSRTPQLRSWIERTARDFFGPRRPGAERARLGDAVSNSTESILAEREFALLVERERNLADRCTRRFCLLVLRGRGHSGLQSL